MMKSLPVVERKDNRKLVGCLRLRRLMAYVLNETPVELANSDIAKEIGLTDARSAEPLNR